MRTTRWGLKALVLTAIFMSMHQGKAVAGWMDALNSATEKLNQASQRMDRASDQMEQARQSGGSGSASHTLTPTTNPIKGTWGSQVTCAGPNTATCQNGMDDIVNCMNQGKGYYYRLVEDNLENKLKNNNPSGQERKDLEADIASVKNAVSTGQVVDADPNDQQRWLKRLTKGDQRQINQMNSKYMNEVRTDCDNRFGGMSRYSSGH